MAKIKLAVDASKLLGVPKYTPIIHSERKFNTMNENNNVNMSAPWNILFKQIKELFKYDSEITVCYTEEEPYIIDILVDSEDKFNALTQLMPPEKEFGNVKVQIRVVSSNKEKTDRELFETLFKGNQIFSRVISSKLPTGDEIGFVMFQPWVAQYYADNLRDPFGNNNELYADIAREVFGPRDGMQYSTIPIQE